MDRVIAKKKWSKKKIYMIAGSVLILSLVGAAIAMTTGASKLNVETDRITISEITKGNFQEFIPVNGVVLPQTTIYLDAIEGGRVEEKLVEDGAMVAKGQPILRLSNTDLELSLVNQETAVFNLLTQMQISRNAAQQNTINRLNQQTDVDNTLKEAERVYKLNKHLYEEKVIGLQEFKQAENAYNYQLQKKRLSDQVIKQDSVNTRQELGQAENSFQRTQNALQLMRKKVGDLIVRAPIAGQLTSLDAEIGQSKNKGERLGQIDVTSGCKVRVDIDEHYISRIFNGLRAEVTVGGKDYKMEIKKVYTQVNSGRFQVDMEFLNEVPGGIRRGQTLQIRLALSDETQAVLVPKGGFYQQTGGNWIFKVNDNGATAFRTKIVLGRQNPDYYEVIEGLKPGDKVVTSSYENYGQMSNWCSKNNNNQNN